MEETNIKNWQAPQSDDVKPDNYLGLAIVAAFFNLICGVVAIIFAIRVNKL